MDNRIEASTKNLGYVNNVSIQVLDADTREVVSEHVGHNAATNSMLTGIAHYLQGDGVLNQGIHLLRQWVPQFISLGTMGLINQVADEEGLPAGIGVTAIDPDDEVKRFQDYMYQTPGYGADGYDLLQNNDRTLYDPIFAGLGPPFGLRGQAGAPIVGTLPQPPPNVCPLCGSSPMVGCCHATTGIPETEPDLNIYDTVKCELISNTFPRARISYRDIIPEVEAELPQTIDVVFSAMISTGALAQFRRPGLDYVFITEVGLWSRPDWNQSGANGLLAGYRIIPPNSDHWDMTDPENRRRLKQQIIRVGVNQVVLVIWKIQLGHIDQLFPVRGDHFQRRPNFQLP